MKPESTTPASARTSPIFPELAPSGIVTVTLPSPSPPKGWANALTSHSSRTITTRMVTIAAIRAGPRRPRVRGPRGHVAGRGHDGPAAPAAAPRPALTAPRRCGLGVREAPCRGQGRRGGLGLDLTQRAVGDRLTALGGVLPGDVEVVGVGGRRRVAASGGDLVGRERPRRVVLELRLRLRIGLRLPWRASSERLGLVGPRELAGLAAVLDGLGIAARLLGFVLRLGLRLPGDDLLGLRVRDGDGLRGRRFDRIGADGGIVDRRRLLALAGSTPRSALETGALSFLGGAL